MKDRLRLRPSCACALLALAVGAAVAAPSRAGSILDLQPALHTDSIVVDGPGGAVRVQLANPNPAVNAWLILTLEAGGGAATLSVHLENPRPESQAVRLDDSGGGAIVLTEDGRSTRCTPWAVTPPQGAARARAASAIDRARASGLPFAPLCDGRLYVRNAVRGSRTTLEATTEFLRDHVWGGERIVGFVKREFFRDAFVARGRAASEPAPQSAPPGAPPPAALAPAAAARPLVAPTLGFELDPPWPSRLPGRWDAVRGADGIYLSTLPGAALAGAPAAALGARWAADAVESDALAFLVAFDLSAFDLGFVLGTDHPRLGWSPRVRDALRDPALPGPDGFDSAAPFVRTGMVSPVLEPRVAATFTGGFKREHSAFRYGALAARERGSHYGFVEQGVVFSRLVPGLATLYVLDDETVDMKTWTTADDALRPRLVSARQNGVPLVEPDTRGMPMPGALVDRWGEGNWSGSPDEQLRTLRAGACLIDQGGRRHLVYGWFSTARPATMARVFLAYGCRYAMHLDMNALEHTYLALYVRQGDRIVVEHLVQGMAQLDRSAGDAMLPRFLGFPDDRDFFVLTRRRHPR